MIMMMMIMIMMSMISVKVIEVFTSTRSTFPEWANCELEKANLR